MEKNKYFRWFFTFLISIFIAPPSFCQTTDWLPFRIPGVMDISIPPCMELQGGVYKALKEEIIRQGLYKIPPELKFGEYAAIFQQIGLNDLKKEAYATYARIMVKYEIDQDTGVGPRLSDRDMPASDIEVLDSMFRTVLANEFKKMNQRLLQWYGTKLVQHKSVSSLQSSFLRQLNDNKPVYVEQHVIVSGKLWITITISSREEERKTTYADIWKVMDTIKVLN